MELFKIRGQLSTSQNLLFGVIGIIILIAIWWLAAEMNSKVTPRVDNFQKELPNMDEWSVERQKVYLDSLNQVDSIAMANATEFDKIYPLLPTPLQVLKAFPDMFQNDEILKNTWISLVRSIKGYFWAILISIIVGFIIGLYPLFNALFGKQLDSLRYLPLTAMTGLFIIWFGIGEEMKVAFLAFGIIVYLLPVVIQRIGEVKDVYTKTVHTLGATDWQTIKTVYIPSVLSKLIDDIRVLTAISWTYIIIIEYINREGGFGALVYFYKRNGIIAKSFAVLFLIILIGFLQDRLFQYLDKRLFPHKYYSTSVAGIQETQSGIYVMLGMTLLAIISGSIFPNLSVITTTILPIILISSFLLILYGEFKIFQSSKVSG